MHLIRRGRGFPNRFMVRHTVAQGLDVAQPRINQFAGADGRVHVRKDRG